jgi:hypothetical protein
MLCSLFPFAEGKYSSAKASLTCTACAAGSSCNALGCLSCTQCQPGSVAVNTGTSICAECAVGQTRSEQREPQCLCRHLTAASLHVSFHLSGRFMADSGGQVCASCSPGRYCGMLGCTECTSCPPGQYVATQGAGVCTPCPTGTQKDMCMPGFIG